MGNIEEIVKDEGYNTDTIICDKPIIRKGHCPYCGVELLQYHDRVPYGDTNVKMITYYCPNGC